MNLCDINHIKPLLARHGFRFSKGLGQNFLCREEVPRAIAEGCGCDKDTWAVEVGPGIGALSRELCYAAKGVVAIELDKRLPQLLAETMKECENFFLVEGDVLKTDLKALCNEHFSGERAVACANLPYYITTPAVSALIDSGCFSDITVMVQREVAKRMCAKPGTSDYGAFTLYINYHATAEIILDVPRDCFIPSPNVDSAVVHMKLLTAPPVEGSKTEIFSVIKAAFAQRRKTLANCLVAGFPSKLDKNSVVNLLEKCNLPHNIRGEQLSLAQFSQLSVEMHKKDC